MDESNKLPLKRVELSLTKFNEVAIPHHLDLLRQHRANILKYEEGGEWGRVRSEQTHARRVCAQLRALLAELDGLRAQVAAPDRARFDHLTRRARDDTLKAIVDYLGVIEGSCRSLADAAGGAGRGEGGGGGLCDVVLASIPSKTSPLSINRRGEGRDEGGDEQGGGSVTSSSSVGLVAPAEQLQLTVDEQELALAQRAGVLRGWSELQEEVRALHGAWRLLHEAARAQAEPVGAAAGSVQAAADHVQLRALLEPSASTSAQVSSYPPLSRHLVDQHQGQVGDLQPNQEARRELSAAERLRAGAYGAGGAALGAVVGGPLGLLVGIKVGAAALLAGSALGYWGARLLGARRQGQIEQADHEQSRDNKHKKKTQ